MCQCQSPWCVGLVKISPLSAVLKCVHYEKEYFKHYSEGEAEARIMYLKYRLTL